MRFLVPLAALMIATPALADDDFCALRPGLANGACTAAKGDVYLETSLADWSLTRDGGQRSYSLSLGSSALRYGLTDTTELQLSVHPFIRQIGHTPTSRDVTQGNGDATIGAKQRLTPKGAKLQLALNPTITLPIATNGLGAGDVEAGVSLSADLPLSKAWTLTVMPQANWLADGDGHGHHGQALIAGSIAYQLDQQASLALDAQLARDWDPAGAQTHAIIGPSLAWMASKRLQLDLEVDHGLTQGDPDLELIAGFAARF